ncbi:MAG: hypothetical protein JXR83_01600 [Deltaproteobacteria bacterium]|nr:hypothetical protein [Deltaproteobacteria bacterium]
MRHLSWLALVALPLACATGKSVVQPGSAPQPADFLVDSNVVQDLQRGAISEATAADGLAAVASVDAERWLACGASAAASAEYRSSRDASLVMRATVVAFADARGAFCGYTPGRGERALRVPDLPGSFEEKGLARAWRAHHVVEVRSASGEPLQDPARGLLRALVARLPGEAVTQIPGSALLPENSLVPDSERIVPTGALPLLEAPALVADVKCRGSRARAIVVEFASTEAAAKALEAYQGHALENFMEVAPLEQNGANGLSIVGKSSASAIFINGAQLLGIIDAKDLASCSEVVTEVATRAAPLTGTGQ